MIISKRLFIYNSIYLFISLIVLFMIYICNNNYNYDNWIVIIAYITLFQTILSLVLFLKNGIKVYQISFIFLLCIFLFYYGQVWLLGIVKNYPFQVYPYNMITIYPEAIYKNTIMICFIVSMCYTLGVVFHKSIVKNCVKDKKENDSSIFKIGVLIILMTLPFNIYENIMYISSSILKGYKSIFSLNINNYISTIGCISVVGFVLIILGINKCYRKRVLVLALFLYLIEMISGNRGPAVYSILTVSSFYMVIEKNESISIKKAFKILIIIFLGLLFVNTIKNYRGAVEKNTDKFSIGFSKALSSNVLFTTMEEFGGTIAVPSITQIYLNNTNNYIHGWTYISALVTIFPNVGGIVNKIEQSGTLVRYLRLNGIYGKYQSIGQSFIAELLFNFKYLWPFFAFIIGIIVEKITSSIEDNYNNIKIAYFVMPVYGIIHWTRGYFSDMIRLIVWSWIIIYLATYIMNKKVRI